MIGYRWSMAFRSKKRGRSMARSGELRLISVGVAPTQVVAEMWRELLAREGIPTMVQSSDAAAYFGASSPCRLLAAADQAERARELLAGMTGEDDVQQGDDRKEEDG